MLVAHVQARNRAVEYWRFCLILLSVLGIVKIVSEPLIEISTGELLTNHRIKKVVRRRVRPGQCVAQAVPPVLFFNCHPNAGRMH